MNAHRVHHTIIQINIRLMAVQGVGKKRETEHREREKKGDKGCSIRQMAPLAIARHRHDKIKVYAFWCASSFAYAFFVAVAAADRMVTLPTVQQIGQMGGMDRSWGEGMMAISERYKGVSDYTDAS